MTPVQALYQGMTSVVPQRRQNQSGFSRCGLSLLRSHDNLGGEYRCSVEMASRLASIVRLR